MTKYELNRMAYNLRVRRKNMGKDRPDKYFYSTEWAGRMTRRQYLDRLNEIDPIECGLFLCDIEHRQMIDDRWWDVPECRAEMTKNYRRRITSIRKQYGLTSSDVARFMKLD